MIRQHVLPMRGKLHIFTATYIALMRSLLQSLGCLVRCFRTRQLLLKDRSKYARSSFPSLVVAELECSIAGAELECSIVDGLEDIELECSIVDPRTGGELECSIAGGPNDIELECSIADPRTDGELKCSIAGDIELECSTVDSRNSSRTGIELECSIVVVELEYEVEPQLTTRCSSMRSL